ncbi:hypothetical protein [Jeotgalibacillus soli]|uniref:Uncharacterized protein n=1 Tax=Jeotgalibacillus soli TaxID=889306 RepID=A0A0C2R4V3_9BACL|nr:hypothetical protein [Jeotgalibacillus soli]KIL45305.1 hypothetical protein KP78_28490 [Jeotgalibacillus soli]
MLTFKYYSLTEMERFEKERVVLSSAANLTEEKVMAMDDRELISLYEECLNETATV